MTINFDHNRQNVTGIAEVVLAEPKEYIDLFDSIISGLQKNQPVLVTRILEEQRTIINNIANEHNYNITWDRYQRTAIIGEIDEIKDEAKVAIISGGTSDHPIVEEIKLSLQYFGLAATVYPDVGVAGIHRHQKALANVEKETSARCIIAVAGNEGALFSVISAQTKLPVIAVPTSIGYGMGGKGMTALQSALQSCSPGIVTVNIDNGFGAAVFVTKLVNSRYDD